MFYFSILILSTPIGACLQIFLILSQPSFNLTGSLSMHILLGVDVWFSAIGEAKSTSRPEGVEMFFGLVWSGLHQEFLTV
jgi:hypothetical protein